MTQTSTPRPELAFGIAFDAKVTASYDAMDAQAQLIERLELDLQTAKAVQAEMISAHGALIEQSNAAAVTDAVVAYVTLKLAERDMDMDDVLEAYAVIRETIGFDWIMQLEQAGEAKGWNLLATLSRETLVQIAKGQTRGQVLGLI